MSQKTIKRRHKENGFFRGVYKKKVVIKMQTERNACHGVEKKDGGMYKTKGLKGSLPINLRYVSVTTTVFMCGRKLEKDGDLI